MRFKLVERDGQIDRRSEKEVQRERNAERVKILEWRATSRCLHLKVSIHRTSQNLNVCTIK